MDQFADATRNHHPSMRARVGLATDPRWTGRLCYQDKGMSVVRPPANRPESCRRRRTASGRHAFISMTATMPRSQLGIVAARRTMLAPLAQGARPCRDLYVVRGRSVCRNGVRGSTRGVATAWCPARRAGRASSPSSRDHRTRRKELCLVVRSINRVTK